MTKARSFASMTRDALKTTALVAAAGAAAGAPPTPPAADSSFEDFLEVFATAEDRGAALEQLVAGTDTHDYFTCLHLQAEGRLDEAAGLMRTWRERLGVQGETALYKQIEARQRMLEASDDPAATYRYLEDELGLHFQHRRVVPGASPDRPTALDPNKISTERLLAAHLRRNSGAALNGLDERTLERLVTAELTENQREALLDRLPRADVPGVLELVLADFEANSRLAFGGRQIHTKLTLEQLDRLRARKPDVANNSEYVAAVLRRLAPGFDATLEDRATRAAYVERLWAVVGTLSSAFDSLKAHVLHQQLELDLAGGTPNAERLRQYLALPRNTFYAPRAMRESRRTKIDFSQSYGHMTPFGAIGDDRELVEDYLSAVLRNQETYDAFASVLDESYLRRVFARTKLLHGPTDEAGRWTEMLGGPRAVEALREEVRLEFARGSRQVHGTGEAVTLELDVKNVDELIVKVFEIDPVAVFDRFGTLDVDTLDLDGLVPGEERVLAYDAPPIHEHRESLRVPASDGNGLFVVELIGGGLSSRAVLRMGSLRLVERTGAAGHMIRVVGADGAPVDGAVLRFGGRDFTPDESGEILVPYTQKPGRKTVLLRAGGIAAVRPFEHQGEQYRLEAQAHAPGEALLAGDEATFVVRPRLSLNDERIDLATLEDPVLVVSSTDEDGDVSTRRVTDLDLTSPDEFTVTVRVPERTRNFSLRFEATVRSIVDGEDQTLAADTRSFPINTIEAGSPTQSLLVPGPNGYHLEVRGRNGEVEPDVEVAFRFHNAVVDDTVHETLKTDARGRIQLGALADIDLVEVSGPSHLRSYWNLDRAHHFGLPSVIHARTGQTIRVPYTGRFAAAHRSALSLIELRDGLPLRDAYANLSLDRRYVVAEGLGEGEYELTLKESGDRFHLRVIDGETVDGYYVGRTTAFEASPVLPLQIIDIERGDDGFVVTLGGAGDEARVHVSATHFIDPNDLAWDLALDALDAPEARSTVVYPSTFQSGRVISDEYRYILARRRSEPWVGNMLERPGVLLNPWSTRETSDSMMGVGGGGGATYGSRFGGKKNLRAAGRARSQGRTGSGPEHQRMLDFLAEPAVLMANLVPDENGRVVVPFDALGSKHVIQIVATDGRCTASVDVTGEPVEPALRDRRLMDALDPATPMLQRRRIVFARAGEAVRIRDGVSATTKTYDTLSDVFELYASTGDGELQKFAFITRWPSLSEEDKREKYSEFVCHELNAFLREKDPAFFASVVRPYMENKAHRTFMDDWLLDADLSGYLEPWHFERLNDVEKILLLQRLDGDAARVASDLLAVVPRGTFSLERTFGQVLAVGALEEQGKGLDSRMNEVRRRAKAARPERKSEGSDAFFIGRGGGAGDAPAAAGLVAPGAPAPAEEPILEDFEVAEAELADMDDELFDLGEDARATDKWAAESRGRDRALRQEVAGRFFRDLDDTEEYAETHYWRVRLANTNGGLVTISPFWADFARANGDSFVSEKFPLANRNTTERLLALAFLDLPFEAAEHGFAVDGRAVTLTAASPLLVALEDLVTPEAVAEDSSLLVGQDFFRVDQRFQTVDGVQREKYVTGEFLTGVPYGCRVVVTNPTSQPVELNALLQIPEGSIPLGTTEVTDGRHLEISPYGTQSLETTFYFPETGTFTDFPVHVGRDATLVARADAATLSAVDELSVQDTSTWEWVSQNGSLEDTLAYLEANNPRELELSMIGWRMSDANAFDAVTARLERRNVYEDDLWQYAIKHQRPRRSREYLEHSSRARNLVGYAFRSPLLDVVPEEDGSYEHLAYEPLVNGRILPFGDEDRIQNDDLRMQYRRFLTKVALQPALTPSDEMELCYYLLLQDRVPETLERFAGIGRDEVRSDVQYDYMRAYLGFSRGETAEAGEIAARYADHPVERWRNRFQNVLAQIEEIEGRGNTDVVDPDDRDQSQGALAGAEPLLDLVVEAGRIRVDAERIDEVELRFYAMDIEFLFSSSPFVEGDRGAFGLVQPNLVETVQVAKGAGGVEVDVPADFAGRNVLVEARGAGLARRATYFAGSVGVQGIERYGQIRVVDRDTKQPLPKTYVKVYARLADGSVRFHKDGYTDLRGRFDYVSLSGVEGSPAKRYAVLAMSEGRGATVTELAPPAR